MVYTSYSESDIKTKYHVRPITIGENKFLITKNGEIFRKMKSNNWKMIENKGNHKKGYNVIQVDKKQYMRSTLIAMAYFKLLTTRKYCIYHKNKDKLDTKITNLKIVYLGKSSRE